MPRHARPVAARGCGRLVLGPSIGCAQDASLVARLAAGRPSAGVARQRSRAGEGMQEAIGWQDGRPWYGPSGTCDIEADVEPGYHLISRVDGAINAGLRALG